MRAREEEARARRANAEVTVLNPLAPSIRTSAPLVPVSSPPTHLGRVVRADEGLLRRRGAVTSTASAAFDGEGASSAAAAALAKGSSTRAACVKQLEAMRDGDRAPDVRGAAGRALAPFGA